MHQIHLFGNVFTRVKDMVWCRFPLRLCSQLYLWGSPLWWDFLRMWPIFGCFFMSDHRGGHIPSLWIVHTRYVFVAGIHLSRTWMSGSLESMRWNVCVHRLGFGLYSHLKEFLGNGLRTHVNSKKIIPSTGSSEEDQTHDTASRRITNPTHYQLSYFGPRVDCRLFCIDPMPSVEIILTKSVPLPALKVWVYAMTRLTVAYLLPSWPTLAISRFLHLLVFHWEAERLGYESITTDLCQKMEFCRMPFCIWMRNLQICVISSVWLLILTGKKFNVGHCMQTFQLHSFIPVLLVGTVDLYHFKLLLDLDLDGRSQWKAKPLQFMFSLTSQLMGMKYKGVA